MPYATEVWPRCPHRQRVAWGATTTYYDMADAYLETISADGDGVVFNGETVPFITVNHTFEVANTATGVLEPQVVPLKIVPHHGPVLSLDAASGKAVSLRWTGNDMTTDINFLTDLNFSNNIAEAKVAIRRVTSSRLGTALAGMSAIQSRAQMTQPSAFSADVAVNGGMAPRASRIPFGSTRLK